MISKGQRAKAPVPPRPARKAATVACAAGRASFGARNLGLQARGQTAMHVEQYYMYDALV